MNQTGRTFTPDTKSLTRARCYSNHTDIRCGLDNCKTVFSSRQEQKCFSSMTRPDRPQSSPSVLFNGYLCIFSTSKWPAWPL